MVKTDHFTEKNGLIDMEIKIKSTWEDTTTTSQRRWWGKLSSKYWSFGKNEKLLPPLAKRSVAKKRKKNKTDMRSYNHIEKLLLPFSQEDNR